MLGWILCKVKGCDFRRARKGEDQALKFCRRCAATVAVRKRVPQTPRPE